MGNQAHLNLLTALLFHLTMRYHRHLHRPAHILFQQVRLDLLSLRGEEERTVMAVERQVAVEEDEAVV
jgi:hypothetical protein